MTIDVALQHPWLSDAGLARCAPLHRSISYRLRSFTRLQRLRRLLLNVVAQRLSRQQIRDLHHMFVALVRPNHVAVGIQKLCVSACVRVRAQVFPPTPLFVSLSPLCVYS